MKIAVVSNMYPDKNHPSYGVFVKNFCDILNDLKIEHNDCVMIKSNSKIQKIIKYIKFYVGTSIYLIFGAYDIIYVHYASHSSIPVIFANLFRKKKIYTNLHGSDVVPENTKQEKMQKYTKKILSISDKVIVPSEYFKKYVSEKYGLDSNIIFISPSGGVNSKVFYKEKSKQVSNTIKLGYVGRISHKKGWDTMLKACSKLKIPYDLTVVGNGPEYKQMRDLASELNIENKITWFDLLPQDQLRRIYNDIDVFLFPTEREGESLGLVAIEAMACGTPVIATDFAAPKYYVRDGWNGFKFSFNDVDVLCNCIERFASFDQNQRDVFSKNALETAEYFSYSSVKNEIKKMLETLL